MVQEKDLVEESPSYFLEEEEKEKKELKTALKLSKNKGKKIDEVTTYTYMYALNNTRTLCRAVKTRL